MASRAAKNGGPISKELAEAKYRDKETCNKIQRSLRRENQEMENKFRKDLGDVMTAMGELTGVVHATVEDLQVVKKERWKMLMVHIGVTSIVITVVGVLITIVVKSSVS